MIDIFRNPARYAKFISAGLMIVAFFASQYGINLPEGWAAETQGVIENLLLAATPIIVYFWPNAE